MTNEDDALPLEKGSQSLVNRERAFEDYVQFRNSKGKRSIEGLWKMYIQNARAGHPVPTTNRQTIYQWSKQDDWEGRVKERDLDEIERDRHAYDSMRIRGQDALLLFAVKAVDVLADIAMNSKIDAERYKAATAILDRVGLSPQTSRATSTDTPPAPALVPPPANATEDELHEWLYKSQTQKD